MILLLACRQRQSALVYTRPIAARPEGLAPSHEWEGFHPGFATR